jgi:hypothetical protein
VSLLIASTASVPRSLKKDRILYGSESFKTKRNARGLLEMTQKILIDGNEKFLEIPTTLVDCLMPQFIPFLKQLKNATTLILLLLRLYGDEKRRETHLILSVCLHVCTSFFFFSLSVCEQY